MLLLRAHYSPDPNSANTRLNDTTEIGFAFPYFKTLTYDPDIGIEFKSHGAIITPGSAFAT